jgi:hypothetical protein
MICIIANGIICDVCFCIFCFYFSWFFWFLHARQRIFVSAAPRMQQEEAEAEDVGETGACTIEFCNGDPILSSCVYDAFAQVLPAVTLEKLETLLDLANMSQCAVLE